MIGRHHKQFIPPGRRAGQNPLPQERKIRAPHRILGILTKVFLLLLIFGFLGGLGYLGYLGYNSALFKIAKVTVMGNQQFKQEDVPLLSELVGRNILSLDTGEVKKAVEQTPVVKRAIVSRQFPSQEVVVLVEERQPSAVWQVKDRKYVVDDEGAIFQQAPLPTNVPLILDMDTEAPKVGARVEPEAVQLALKLTEAVPGDTGMKAKNFEYLKRGGLVVVTDKGWRARFGDAQDFEFKMAVWKAAMQKAAKDKLKVNHIDLRFGTRPFVSLRG